jgi:hypothetical protein
MERCGVRWSGFARTAMYSRQTEISYDDSVEDSGFISGHCFSDASKYSGGATGVLARPLDVGGGARRPVAPQTARLEAGVAADV